VKHLHWLEKLLARSDASSRFHRLGTRPKSIAKRRATFEQLEPRLVLTVSLRPGPVPDDVVLFPAAQAGDFEIAADPIDAVDKSIVDLSVVTSADQRHGISLSSDTLVKIDVNERYTLSARSLNSALQFDTSAAIVDALQVTTYDVDRNLIEPLHVTRYDFATDTTLAAPLLPGDTFLLVDDASGWSNDPWQSAETRALAWYGYSNSTGHTYADYTYTRNVAAELDDGLWKPGGVQYDSEAGAYRIDLLQPWDGPALLDGSAIRNAATTSNLTSLSVVTTQSKEHTWVDYAATLGGGVWQTGQPDAETFPPGAAFLKPDFSLPATDVVFGPEQDSAFGAPSDPTRPTVSTDSNRSVELDLDVLGKRALGGVSDASASDFDSDGDRDGFDFLAWQRGFGTTYNADDLVDWEDNYSFVGTVEIDSVANPLYGTATIATDQSGMPVVHYESDPWFVGTDLVHYTLRNSTSNKTYDGGVAVEVLGGNVEQDPAMVAILQNQAQVVIGNEAPSKQFGDLKYVTTAGHTLLGDGVHNHDLLAYISDPVDQLVVRLLDGPNHGTLSVNFDGTFEYVPEADFFGTDTFRYEAFDGLHSTSAVAEISVLETPDDLLQHRMEEVGLGMLIYDDVFGRFPPASDFDFAGNPYLSWRVHLLPWMEYRSLYDQFNLDEPWNSANNLPLLDQMPDVFRSVGDQANSTTTRFQTFTGPDAPFGREVDGSDQLGPRSREFADGLAHTLLFVESGADEAVPWTKPDDLVFDPVDPLAALGTITSGKINGVTGDGSTISLTASIDPADFSALITIDGGEVVDAGTLHREYREANNDPVTDPLLVETATNDQFRAVSLAVLNFLDRRKKFPTNFYDVDDGSPLLSWRVAILPELGHANLYNQFHFDEPWDSSHNLSLLDKMPDLFRNIDDLSGTTSTRLQAITDDALSPKVGWLFPARLGHTGYRPLQISSGSISDGLSNTILFTEAGADKTVPWTKPDDLLFNYEDPLATFGNIPSGPLRAAMFDANVLRIPTDIAPPKLTALATRAGREVLDGATIENQGLQELGQSKSPQDLQNDFKRTMLAMHNYQSARILFPANRFANDGTPLLSWRVEILPYIEQRNLYDQFHRDEPWDSPHNLTLLKYMPDVFRSSGDPTDSTTTRMMTFGGEGAPFPVEGMGANAGIEPRQITDGTSNTIAIVDAGAGSAVPWTKPTGIDFHANNPFSALGELGYEIPVAYFDGSVRPLLSSVSTAELNARITHNGGENLNDLPPHVPVSQFFVNQTAGDTITHEFGVDVFDIVLDKAPLSNVVIDVSVSDVSVAMLDRSRLNFTAENWNIPQRVALRGIDNHVLNEDQVVDVTVEVVDGLSDNSYDSVATQVFSSTIIDDDLIPGDFNRSGAVDSSDLVVWEAEYNQGSGADADEDGDTDGFDFLAWQRNLTTAIAPIASAAVETPSVLVSEDDRASLVDAAMALELLDSEAEEEGTPFVLEAALVEPALDSVFSSENIPPASYGPSDLDSIATRDPELDGASDPELSDDLLELIFD